MAGNSKFEMLKVRHEELVNIRATTQNTWQEISNHIVGRGDFTALRTPGEQRMQRIYDDTGKISSSLLAGAMHSLLMSPVGRWFEYAFEEPDLMKISGAVDWLDLAEKRVYAALASPSANFHAEVAGTWRDIIDFGTGGLFIDDVPGIGTQFSARPLQELYIAEDPSGRIDTVSRGFQLTARQAVKMWGDKAKKADKDLAAGRTEEKSNYVHIIVPSDDIAVGKKDASGMKWSSTFLSMEDSAIMDEGGYHEMPLATPRWEKFAGEIYGRGPGWNALSNCKMQNEMKRVKITAGQLNIAPPIMVDTSAVMPGDLNWGPRTVIPFDGNMTSGSRPPIAPIMLGGDPRMTTEDIIDNRRSIQDAYHHQLIETIRDPRMTATQVLELSAQMQRHLAPILGRMQTEFLEPVLDRVFAIELRAGRMPEIPDALRGRKIKVNYVSPAARSQQANDARAMLDWMSALTNIGGAIPSVLHVPNADEFARELGRALGVPPKLINDAREVAKIREAEAEQAAQDEAKQDAVMMTDQMAKIAKVMPQEAA